MIQFCDCWYELCKYIWEENVDSSELYSFQSRCVELLELGQWKLRGQIRIQRFERTSTLLYTHISCLVHSCRIRLLAGVATPSQKIRLTCLLPWGIKFPLSISELLLKSDTEIYSYRKNAFISWISLPTNWLLETVGSCKTLWRWTLHTVKAYFGTRLWVYSSRLSRPGLNIRVHTVAKNLK
jgi:hypothetical protein